MYCSRHINSELYEKLYKESLENPEQFWAKQANRIHWNEPFTKAYFAPVDIKWFEDG
ncbi:MAG: acetyl-coenzyme A synthetase N-terminal domain-containing protein [Francisella endosymbiont of Hyalomma scupense]|uniref:acetyl-coenzyme A synthetase N-terminal domain-containing protein n=1 Tax=Francisella-like endosymbiont TaxID=512373 RepID=UPI00296FD954